MRGKCITTFAAVAATIALSAPGASAEQLPVNGNWQSLLNCLFTSYDPLSTQMSCIGSTLWNGALTGVTRYVVNGVYDPVSGDAHGMLHETFRGRDDDGDRGTIGFDETFTLKGATSALHIDVTAVGGTGGFAGVRGWMTFDGTDNAATGNGSYTGELRLPGRAR